VTDDPTRRETLKVIATAGAAAAACTGRSAHKESKTMASSASDGDAIVSVTPLGFPWRTHDPFIVCVHHDDRYPAGNDRMGPDASLVGRDLGQDFAGKDGWRMYHGQAVPGFPQHPHRGFETVTVVRRGLLDHSDSVGAAARYGGGDVQWLTAGGGILHAEMFPLIERRQPNPLELFQIWINLPRAKKLVDPHFSMFWSEQIPRRRVTDEAGRTAEVTVVAGRYGDAAGLAPPPDSWAAVPEADVAIWTIKLAPGARFSLPPAAVAGAHRSLYYFAGRGLRVGGREISHYHEVELLAEREVTLEGGPDEAELLLLQGRPIAEPVVQYGPFVMTTREEIQQAFADFHRTGFGGWPWPSDEPVHPRQEGRFARHADGRVERPI
jgi:redox-sensitive bicupin YhaK (pirin superfamily)